MSQFICATPECDEELSKRSKLPHCSNCRASMGMWKRRGIRAILIRRSKLKKYDSRMAFVSEVKSVPDSRKPARKKA